MKIHQTLRLALVAVLGIPALPVLAQQPNQNGETQALLRRIEALEQQVKILDRKRELGDETAAERAKTATVVSFGAGGLQIRSADTNFSMRLRGYVQVDGRFFPNDHSATPTRNDTFLVRRLRPIIEGTVYDKYDYRIMLDFPSGSPATAGNDGFVADAYVNARLFPQFQIQAGKFKEPVGLERLQSGGNLLFVERGYPTQLVPNRDVGLQFQGDLFEGRLRYEAGIFNGVANGGSGDNEQADDEKDFALRVFSTPFVNSDHAGLRGLGIGISGTVGDQDGALRPFVTPGQQTFFTPITGAGTAAAPNVAASGKIWRVSPQLYFYYGPFGLFAEGVLTSQEVTRTAGAVVSSATLEHTAWQVAGSWFVTGEDNSFKAVVPRQPFKLGGEGWGALELTARVGKLSLDNATFPLFSNPATSAKTALSWGGGVNWHLNRNVKLTLNYEQTDFSGGTSPFLTEGEKAILTRVQFSF